MQIFGEREETVEFLKEFLRCNLRITFGHTYVRMSEHLAHRFNRDALFQGDKCGKGMPCSVVNTSISKCKRNIGINKVTGCELIVFLYSATDRGRQNCVGY